MECFICFETVQERLALPLVQTPNGDVQRSRDCGHAVCSACMAKHVAARVEDQRVFGLCCPAVGCKNELFEKDLRKLVQRGDLEGSVVSRFVELRARDFTARATGFVDSANQQDYSLLRRLWETTRLCPRCSVAVEKAAGCNSFWCICGHHFDYEKAPRAVGSGVKNFKHVIAMAEALRMPLQAAEQVGEWKMYFKARRVSEALIVPLEVAVDVCKKAQKGDAEARSIIRSLRTEVV